MTWTDPEPPPGGADLQRLALGLEYDGRRFFGFQRQRQSPTVQESLEIALARVANHAVTVHCAGRTDTGVHATCQVVHFDTRVRRSERSWVLGANTNLPDGITVRWLRLVTPDFHARFSATGRHYEYRILNRWVRPALDLDRVSWERRGLDADAMQTAARALIGEHDFSSFRALGCQAKHPVRTIHAVEVSRGGEFVRIGVHANGFLYHMVRNMAGSLMEVGAGARPVDWIGEVLAARDRAVAGPTAPAGGLYFTGVDYPDQWQLPVFEPVSFPRAWNRS